MEGLNQPKYGGDFTKKKYWKLKDGESVYRILPGLGPNENWSKFYSIHYGYKNSQDKMRPFQSPEVRNFKTKMIEVSDPAKERIESLKAELERAKAEKNDALVAKLLTYVGSKKARYNLDSYHYMNVIDSQGNIGVLKIRHKAKLALDATINRLRGAGVDPLSADNGRFFVFRRAGNALDTTFQVEVYQEEIDAPGLGKVKRDYVHKITPDIYSRLFTIKKTAEGSKFFFNKEAADLNNLFPRPTSEEVARIVKEGAKAVDEIIDAKNGAQAAAEDHGDTAGDTEEGDTQVAAAPLAASPGGTATLPLVQAAAPVAQAVSAPVAAPTPAPAPQASAPAPAPVASAPAAPKTTAQAVTEMSDEEFLKQFNL